MKRILSLLIAFSMLIQVTAFARGTVFTDVTGREYYAEAAEKLFDEGIISGYEDGSLGADRAVTRAEMATFICRLLGAEDEAFYLKGTTTHLTQDVPRSHWASGYVAYAVQKGIVNGDGNGKFRPDDKVSHKEAVKMLVCAAGLEDSVVPVPGDWAQGYINAANDAGILDNVRQDGGIYSNRSDVVMMIFNVLAHLEGETHDIVETFEAEVIRLVNEERSKHGLNALSRDEKLTDVAYAHSYDMRDRNFFNHENPDGKSPFDRMKAAGISYRTAAENIAKGQRTPEEVMNGWMNSPGHRANILREGIKYIGVGICECDYGYIWTQCFTG